MYVAHVDGTARDCSCVPPLLLDQHVIEQRRAVRIQQAGGELAK